MAAKHNITLAIDGTLLKCARALAARRGLSVSALLADELRGLVDNDSAYESARRRRSPAGRTVAAEGVRIDDRESLHERHRVR